MPPRMHENGLWICMSQDFMHNGVVSCIAGRQSSHTLWSFTRRWTYSCSAGVKNLACEGVGASVKKICRQHPMLDHTWMVALSGQGINACLRSVLRIQCAVAVTLAVCKSTNAAATDTEPHPYTKQDCGQALDQEQPLPALQAPSPIRHQKP